MTADLSLADRIRIERAVWTLDRRLYGLPRTSRLGHRRELRTNLTVAARVVGVRAAIRDLGDQSLLAAGYLDAELGPGPRPSWISAVAFLATTTLFLTSLLFDAAQAFGEGVVAGNPRPDGTYHWSGVAHLQTAVTYTVANGEVTQTGGPFTSLTWVLLAVGTITFGRLWRLPLRRPRRAA